MAAQVGRLGKGLAGGHCLAADLVPGSKDIGHDAAQEEPFLGQVNQGLPRELDAPGQIAPKAGHCCTDRGYLSQQVWTLFGEWQGAHSPLSIPKTRLDGI